MFNGFLLGAISVLFTLVVPIIITKTHSKQWVLKVYRLRPDFADNRLIFVLHGNEYWWSGWFGSQLASYENKRFPAGTKRILKFDNNIRNIVITVFTTERIVIGYRTTWSVSGGGTIAEHSDRIKELKKLLSDLT